MEAAVRLENPKRHIAACEMATQKIPRCVLRAMNARLAPPSSTESKQISIWELIETCEAAATEGALHVG